MRRKTFIDTLNADLGDDVAYSVIKESGVNAGVKLMFGQFGEGEFIEFFTLDASDVQSVSVQKSCGESGAFAFACPTSSSITASVLTTSLGSGNWEDYAIWACYDMTPFKEYYEAMYGAWPFYSSDLDALVDIGVFKVDKQSISDDKLFTTFTAYDALYWMKAVSVKKSDYDMLASDPYVAAFSYISDTLNELYARAASEGSSEWEFFQPEIRLFPTPSHVATMSFTNVSRPQGTALDVIASYCQQTASIVDTEDGDIRFSQYERNDGIRLDVADQAAGSLAINGRKSSALMAVLLDVGGAELTNQTTKVDVDIVLPVQDPDDPITIEVAGGYFQAIKDPTWLKDGVPFSSASALLSDIELDVSYMSQNYASASSMFSEDGGMVRYTPYSVSANGLCLAKPGDWIIVEEFEPNGAPTERYVPIIDASYDFDGAWTASFSAAAGDENADDYEVMTDGTVRRSGWAEEGGVKVDDTATMSEVDENYLKLSGGTLTGNLALTNTHGIRIEDANGSAKEIAAVNASNQFSFGYGAYVNNYQTIIRGGSIMKMAVAKNATGGGESNSVTLHQDGSVSFGDAAKWRDGLALTAWTSFSVTADTSNTVNIRSQNCAYNAALGLVFVNVQFGITASAAIAAGARTPAVVIPTAYRPSSIVAISASHVQTGTTTEMVNAWAHNNGTVYVRKSAATAAGSTSDYIQVSGVWHV